MNHYKATIILIVVSIGFLITYPFNYTFIGGLLSSGFCAATIGGFADWFGVSALFRKPLNIPYKTEIIPRNREKIFNELSDMVGNELLTKDKINELINKNSISKVLIKYTDNYEEKQQLKEIISDIIQDIILKINPIEAGRLLEGLIKNNISNINISNILISTIEFSIKRGYDASLINFVVDELIKILETEQLKGIIAELLEETIRSYEKDSAGRVLVNKIVFDILLQISPYDMAEIIQHKLVEDLHDFKNPINPNREKFMQWIDEKILQLKNSERLQQKIETWKIEQINKLEIHNEISKFIKSTLETKNENLSTVISLSKKINIQIDKVLDEFKVNLQWQNKLDFKIRRILSQLVDKNHDKIGIIVSENLNRFPNDVLVELIESKVGNDLQMIRINGSVIGGIVGMAIFLLTFWI